jgi:hypothetical protein
MEHFPMFRVFSRSAVAALVTMSVAFPVGAQATGSVVPARPRDTMFFKVFVPNGGSKDSTLTLFLKTFDREAYGTPGWFSITKQLDSLLIARRGSGNIMVRGLAGGMTTSPQLGAPQGWIGFVAQGLSEQISDPNGLRVTYFAYPRITSVDPDSPAEHAGIVPGDVLVAYNGIDVVGHEFNLAQLLVPERKVGVTIRRDGEPKDYSLTALKTPVRVSLRRMDFDAAMPADVQLEFDRARAQFRKLSGVGGVVVGGQGERAPGLVNRVLIGGPMLPGGRFIISPNGVFGASLVAVGADLAKVLKLDKGVLVTEVAPDTPASTAGLQVGDVVVTVAGQPVTTVREVQDVVGRNFGEHTVPLQIVREKKAKSLTVTLP